MKKIILFTAILLTTCSSLASSTFYIDRMKDEMVEEARTAAREECRRSQEAANEEARRQDRQRKEENKKMKDEMEEMNRQNNNKRELDVLMYNV